MSSLAAVVPMMARARRRQKLYCPVLCHCSWPIMVLWADGARCWRLIVEDIIARGR